MAPAWALRQEDLLHNCIVSPDVFNPMMDRLRDFVVPYQHTLETGAVPHSNEFCGNAVSSSQLP